MLSLSKILEPQFSVSQIFENKIIYFTGNEYQRIFIPFFLKKLGILNKITINYIDIDDDINVIKAKLEMTFLGKRSYFWLGNVSEVSDKKKNEIIDYLSSYNGNNVIFLFLLTDSIDQKKNYVIECDLISNFEQLKNMIIFFDKSVSKNTLYSLEKLFKNFNQMSVDQAHILYRYALLLGVKIEEFKENWLDKIFITDESIFTLSKYFFAKDIKSFYKAFDNISKDYSPVFWSSFLSEQLFRAWAFLKFKALKNEVEARRVAYKLPFSFINYDWRKYSVSELANAHKFIYNIDFGLKNGSSEASLDLFYANFFSGKFN